LICDSRLDDFDAYAAGVRSGSVVACEHVKNAVERFYGDLERQESETFPYYFDRETAAAMIAWFPEVLRHTVGRHAGRRFRLEPWQQFGIGNIYGWKNVDDGARRFRSVFWTMGRKNGKSCLAAGMSIYAAGYDVDPETGLVEEVPEVILAAAKREQADRVTFAESRRMAEKSPILCHCTETKFFTLNFPKNKGSISTVGSNRAYDGLNPSAVMLDELHEWRDPHQPFYDTMVTGSGSRSQPLSVVTTTAGDERSYIWKREYEYACGVAAGRIEDEKLFSFIFELDRDDDPFDEACWIKANPNIGVSIKLDYLRDAAKKAQQSKIDLNRFLRYHGNRLVTTKARTFDMKVWAECRGELSDWREADAIAGGIDLGGRDDLCAWGLVARFPTGQLEEVENEAGEVVTRPIWRYELKAKTYIAHATERDVTKPPFADWIHEERIVQCEHPICEMRDDLLAMIDRLYITDVAYDPAGGQMLAEIIEREGIVIASMAQTFGMFNEPIGELLQALREGRVRHDGDPVLEWCASNALTKRDRQDRWMYDKASSGEKIDPIVAVTMAFRRCQLAPERARGELFIA
jgi:phage terminase large subunit-like protein